MVYLSTKQINELADYIEKLHKQLSNKLAK